MRIKTKTLPTGVTIRYDKKGNIKSLHSVHLENNKDNKLSLLRYNEKIILNLINSNELI